MKSMQYFLHDLLNIKHHISIKKIDTIDSKTLRELISEFPICHPIGWNFDEQDPFSSFSKDILTNINFFKNDNSIKFNFDAFCPLFDEYVSNKYPELMDVSASTSFCETIYANMHNDMETILCRGQLMFIYENDSNHTLYSMDKNNVLHSIIPKNGDILFLDIACNHALIPNDKNEINNLLPLKMGLVAISNF